jgi:subtilase family serine protease
MVRNQGQGNPGSFRVGIYLSKDPVITTSDTLLGYTSVNALPAGSQQAITSSVKIPSGSAAGTYYIGAIGDYTNAVAESDETNNALAGNQIGIGPDLVMISASGQSSARAGQQITVSHTGRNQGQGSAGYFRVGIYLSTDDTVTTGDIYLGQATISYGLGAGSQQSISTRVTVPSSLAAGTYYIGVVADRNNNVAEANETNNALVGNQIVISR